MNDLFIFPVTVQCLENVEFFIFPQNIWNQKFFDAINGSKRLHKKYYL